MVDRVVLMLFALLWFVACCLWLRVIPLLVFFIASCSLVVVVVVRLMLIVARFVLCWLLFDNMRCLFDVCLMFV